MKNFFKLSLTICAAFLLAFAGFSNASALTMREGAEAARCDWCPTDLFAEDGGVFRQITNTILYIVGVIAVIMIIWGGIRYIISGGDSKKVTDAKNTILYAIIGLIIAVLSYAIVNFVMNALPSTSTEKDVSEETAFIEPKLQ